jgi:hypothetical protein
MQHLKLNLLVHANASIVNSVLTHTPRWSPLGMGYCSLWVPAEGEKKNVENIQSEMCVYHHSCLSSLCFTAKPRVCIVSILRANRSSKSGIFLKFQHISLLLQVL